jgi:hypothetical protein
MLSLLLTAGVLVGITVAIHAVGIGVLLKALAWLHAETFTGFRRVTWLVIGLACWLMLVHLVEIAVWGLFFFWRGCLPGADAETAFYFSGATYTTVGYGDIVLPKAWRLLSPIEAMTGILMGGLSACLFFAIAGWYIRNWMKRNLALDGTPGAPANPPDSSSKHSS